MLRAPLVTAAGLGLAIALLYACSSTDATPAPATTPTTDAAPSTDAAPPTDGVAAPADAKPGTTVALGQPLPDLQFVKSDGTAVKAYSFAEPSASTPHLLVFRAVTGWCGTCRWQAANTAAIVPAGLEGRVRIVDVVLASDDNGPPGAADVAAWGARAGGAVTALGDPGSLLAPLFPARAALPLVALVDPRTMTPLRALSGPGADALADALAAGLAQLDGKAAPPPATPALADGRFTRDQQAMIAQMALTGATTDTTNARESDPSAIALGRSLFFDAKLSPSIKGVSCGSCHLPDLLYQDGKDQAPEGVGSGARNVPTVILAADQKWLFWDGRADSPWSQAIMPIEDPNEMASSRLFVAHAVRDTYQAPYEALFGALPPLDDTARFPAAGKPGDAAWNAMPEADRTLINRVFSNVGKALAAFEHSLRPAPNGLDRYAQGHLDALTGAEKDGLLAFFQAGCAQCHWGPRLTDDSFHALRFPTGRPDRAADRGRTGGLPALLASEFRRSGAFSDAPEPVSDPPDHARLLGAFKTPGLRGVGYTLPYGHGGGFGGLTSTLDAHRTQGLPPESPYAAGASEPWLTEFDAALIPKIITFLNGLTADVPR
jgi:cytochrome c peroxidase